MESKIDDGGPAFPMPSGHEPRVNSFTHFNEGMSLRDYFASMPLGDQEMQMVRDFYFAEHPGEESVNLHTLRYFNADAMLKARAQ